MCACAEWEGIELSMSFFETWQHGRVYGMRGMRQGRLTVGGFEKLCVCVCVLSWPTLSNTPAARTPSDAAGASAKESGPEG